MGFIRNLDRIRPIENVRKAVLPSGLTVVAEEAPQFQSLTVGLWILSGSQDEPGELAGISHFIEHMVFKGTRKNSALQIAKKTEAIGGQIDAFTSREQTCFYARVFEEHLEPAIEILGDLVSNPVFDREMIERERGVVIEEIETYENNPEEQAHDLIAEAIWPNHPLGRPILGTRRTIDSFGTRSLKRYHRARYTPGNILVAASGAVRLERLTDLAARYIRLPSGPSRNGKYPMTRFRSRAIKFDKEVTQASLALAGRGPSYLDDDRHALSIVNMILGAGLSSRLFQRIREEEGLAYTVYSFLDVLRDTGLFGIYLGVAPDNTRRCLDLTCREIRRLKRGGVRRWEIESAKAQILMNHFLAYESTYERMNRIAQSEICYGRQAALEQIVARIQEIGENEVRQAIERYLRPQRFSVVTVGPPGGKYPRAGEWDF